MAEDEDDFSATGEDEDDLNAAAEDEDDLNEWSGKHKAPGKNSNFKAAFKEMLMAVDDGNGETYNPYHIRGKSNFEKAFKVDGVYIPEELVLALQLDDDKKEKEKAMKKRTKKKKKNKKDEDEDDEDKPVLADYAEDERDEIEFKKLFQFESLYNVAKNAANEVIPVLGPELYGKYQELQGRLQRYEEEEEDDDEGDDDEEDDDSQAEAESASREEDIGGNTADSITALRNQNEILAKQLINITKQHDELQRRLDDLDGDNEEEDEDEEDNESEEVVVESGSEEEGEEIDSGEGGHDDDSNEEDVEEEEDDIIHFDGTSKSFFSKIEVPLYRYVEQLFQDTSDENLKTNLLKHVDDFKDVLRTKHLDTYFENETNEKRFFFGELETIQNDVFKKIDQADFFSKVEEQYNPESLVDLRDNYISTTLMSAITKDISNVDDLIQCAKKLIKYGFTEDITFLGFEDTRNVAQLTQVLELCVYGPDNKCMAKTKEEDVSAAIWTSIVALLYNLYVRMNEYHVDYVLRNSWGKVLCEELLKARNQLAKTDQDDDNGGDEKDMKIKDLESRIKEILSNFSEAKNELATVTKGRAEYVKEYLREKETAQNALLGISNIRDELEKAIHERDVAASNYRTEKEKKENALSEIQLLKEIISATRKKEGKRTTEDSASESGEDEGDKNSQRKAVATTPTKESNRATDAGVEGTRERTEIVISPNRQRKGDPTVPTEDEQKQVETFLEEVRTKPCYEIVSEPKLMHFNDVKLPTIFSFWDDIKSTEHLTIYVWLLSSLDYSDVDVYFTPDKYNELEVVFKTSSKLKNPKLAYNIAMAEQPEGRDDMKFASLQKANVPEECTFIIELPKPCQQMLTKEMVPDDRVSYLFSEKVPLDQPPKGTSVLVLNLLPLAPLKNKKRGDDGGDRRKIREIKE